MMYIIVDAYEQYEYNFPTSLTSHSIDRRVNDGIRKFVAHDCKLMIHRQDCTAPYSYACMRAGCEDCVAEYAFR